MWGIVDCNQAMKNQVVRSKELFSLNDKVIASVVAMWCHRWKRMTFNDNPDGRDWVIMLERRKLAAYKGIFYRYRYNISRTGKAPPQLI